MGIFKDSGKRDKRKAAGKKKVAKGGDALRKRRTRKKAKNKRQGRWPT